MQVKPAQEGQGEQMVGGIPVGQGMGVRLRIRGVYATALTKLLTDLGYVIVDPSAEIQERIPPVAPPQERPEVVIQDQEDHQGILVAGKEDKVAQLVRVLQEHLLDAVLLEWKTGVESEGAKPEGGPRDYKLQDLVRAKLEFPGTSKETLDRIRSSVVPTLARHHRLRIIDPNAVDRLEELLQRYPEEKEELEEKSFQEQIWVPLQKTGLVKIEHVKISGDPIHFREGVLMEAADHRILIKRSFARGRYDGLDLPVEEGDYGFIEVQEGAWYIRHAYYSRESQRKGEYYNINTPVELYPEGARYVDLEVDVIKEIGERPFIVDQEKLALLAARGVMGRALERNALEMAEGLIERLRT
jgi:hypothetical protein